MPSQTTEHFAEKKIAKNLRTEPFHSRLLTTIKIPSRLQFSCSAKRKFFANKVALKHVAMHVLSLKSDNR